LESSGRKGILQKSTGDFRLLDRAIKTSISLPT